MKRREMILKALQTGALITLAKPLQIFANEKKNAVLTELTGNPLRFPPVFTNGGTMTLAKSNVNVWPGQNTEVLAINGSYPGPSVVIQKGTTFTANFINNHNEPATIHWHGVNAPELMDGHPKDAIPPGGSYTYTFPVINRGGTYFYHSHADMLTAEHVYRGFAGFFIVDDPAELILGLPRGNFDIPLCIQDRRNSDIPDFNYNPVMNDIMNGFLGDTALVNGTPEPYFEVSRTLYRFRLLNGSNARIYKIAFSDSRPFHIIATDGGLKDEAVQVTSFFLSPGERTDILVDFSPYTIGQNVILKSLPFTAPGMGTYRQGTEMNLLRFDVTGNTGSGGIIPAVLPR
ncbi:MAG: multicopper oxidase domain-containing protein [Ignavibacteria bacterium]|nr:multicopper oxidase domain-containing protein [Ignavibacteria bacterium]